MFVVVTEPAFASVAIGDVLLNVWRRGATRADVDELAREIDALASTARAGVVVLMVIPSNTSLPDDEARRAAGAMLRRARLSRVVVVIEGRGFGPGAMRSVFAGLGLVYRPSFAWTVSISLEEAIDWVEAELGPQARAELLAADRRLRAQLEVA